MARPGSYRLDLMGGGQGSTPRKGRRCTMGEKLRAGDWQRLRLTRACFRKPESGGPALGMPSLWRGHNPQDLAGPLEIPDKLF